jgi:hypothetical protein
MQDRLLNEREAGRIIGMSVHSLRKWRGTGGGPPFRRIDGWAIRYSLVQLIDWLAKQGQYRHTGQGSPDPVVVPAWSKLDRITVSVQQRSRTGSVRRILLDDLPY